MIMHGEYNQLIASLGLTVNGAEMYVLRYTIEGKGPHTTVTLTFDTSDIKPDQPKDDTVNG